MSAPDRSGWCTCMANWRSRAARTSAGRQPVEDHSVYKSLDEVGRCACGARLRPHIVFFGEIPLEMDRIQREIARATLMVVVGTSGSVYPAANFVHWARQGGARTVYVGPEPPLNAHAFTNVVEGKAGRSVAGVVCGGVVERSIDRSASKRDLGIQLHYFDQDLQHDFFGGTRSSRTEAADPYEARRSVAQDDTCPQREDEHVCRFRNGSGSGVARRTCADR